MSSRTSTTPQHRKLKLFLLTFFLSLTMSKAGGDESGDGSSETAQQLEDEAPAGKVLSKLSATTIGPGWTKVSCPCCASERVEPLVLVKLGEKVRPETKRWLLRLIGAPQKDGGESSNNSDDLSCRAHVSVCIDSNKEKHTGQTFMSRSLSHYRSLLNRRVITWELSSI